MAANMTDRPNAAQDNADAPGYPNAAQDKTDAATTDAFYNAATPPSEPPLNAARPAGPAPVAANTAVPPGSVSLSPPTPGKVATAGDLASLVAGSRGPTQLRFTARPFVPAEARAEGDGLARVAPSLTEDPSATAEVQLPPATTTEGGVDPLSLPRGLSHGGPRKESIGNRLRVAVSTDTPPKPRADWELRARQRAVLRSLKGLAPLGPSLVRR
jgi:hypothetical protein